MNASLENNTVENPIRYTFPMNKSVRLFMRYQHLMERFNDSRILSTREGSSTAILTLIELYELTSRGDLKADLLREVEKIHIGQSKPGDNGSINAETTEELKRISELIQQLRGQLGAHLKDHDFINAIRQKHAIPGGLNAFDLPIYQYWMNLSFEKKHDRLDNWGALYIQFSEAINRYLSVIHGTQGCSEEIAESGFYAKTLDTRRNYHLLSIDMPAESTVYPEPSLGRHRITLRFMESGTMDESAQQTKQSVHFTLTTICTR